MKDYTKHQQKIIRNYYDNVDTVALQRLQELVANLFLAEGKARALQWKHAKTAMEKLKVPATRIEHIVSEDSPTLLAKLVEELLAKK